MTSAFIASFDTNRDGRVSREEIRAVGLSLRAPYARLVSSRSASQDESMVTKAEEGEVAFEIVNGNAGSNGVLRVRPRFTFTSANANNWHVGIVLENIYVMRSSDNALFYTGYSVGQQVSLDRVTQRSSGGGCGLGSGLATLALALALPLLLRKKSR